MTKLLCLLAGLPLLAAEPPLSDSAIEEFLRTAKVVSTKTLGTGITNSKKAVLESGTLRHDAHVQTVDEQQREFQGRRGAELNFRDSWRYNVAAYKLDRLLDLRMTPVSVERKVGGSTGAVTWWVDDVLMDETKRLKEKTPPPDPHLWNCQMFVVRVFDQLISNTDRNTGNLVIDKDWRLWMIDHTRAFRTSRELLNQKNLDKCRRDLLPRLKALNEEQLKQELKGYLTGEEIKALLARRDAIVAHFAARGEDALYDMPTAASAPAQ